MSRTTSCGCRGRCPGRRRGPPRSGARGASGGRPAARGSAAPRSGGDDPLNLARPARACRRPTRQERQRLRRGRQVDLVLVQQPLAEGGQPPRGDLGQLGLPERAEHHDLVDPVQQLRAEERPQLGQQRLALARRGRCPRRVGLAPEPERPPPGSARAAGSRSARRSPAARPPAGRARRSSGRRRTAAGTGRTPRGAPSRPRPAAPPRAEIVAAAPSAAPLPRGPGSQAEHRSAAPRGASRRTRTCPGGSGAARPAGAVDGRARPARAPARSCRPRSAPGTGRPRPGGSGRSGRSAPSARAGPPGRSPQAGRRRARRAAPPGRQPIGLGLPDPPQRDAGPGRDDRGDGLAGDDLAPCPSAPPSRPGRWVSVGTLARAQASSSASTALSGSRRVVT